MMGEEPLLLVEPQLKAPSTPRNPLFVVFFFCPVLIAIGTVAFCLRIGKATLFAHDDQNSYTTWTWKSNPNAFHNGRDDQNNHTNHILNKFIEEWKNTATDQYAFAASKIVLLTSHSSPYHQLIDALTAFAITSGATNLTSIKCDFGGKNSCGNRLEEGLVEATLSHSPVLVILQRV